MKLYIGENIKQLRSERNMTQEVLAEKLGVSFQSVSRWETGQSYPDVEMIPEIAAFFDVTTDELMGVDKAVMEKRIIEDWDKVNRLNDPTEQLEMYREMHRKYPKNCDVLNMLIYTMSGFPELFPEMRELIDEYLRMPDVRGWERNSVISLLIACKAEENVPYLLDKYANNYPMSNAHLLANRYKRMCDFESEKKYLQHDFMMTNHCLEYVFVRYGGTYRRLLELYNWYTGTQGMNLVSGDGVPDLWYSNRLISGFRYAEECAKEGRIDEAFDILEDTVSLYEAFYSQPAGTVLTFRCKEMSELMVTLTEGECLPVLFNDETKERYKCFFAEELDFGVDLMIRRASMTSHYETHHHYCPQYDIYPLVSKYGWEGFDAIRNDDRFTVLIKRMEKFIVVTTK